MRRTRPSWFPIHNPLVGAPPGASVLGIASSGASTGDTHSFPSARSTTRASPVRAGTGTGSEMGPKPVRLYGRTVMELALSPFKVTEALVALRKTGLAANPTPRTREYDTGLPPVSVGASQAMIA